MRLAFRNPDAVSGIGAAAPVPPPRGSRKALTQDFFPVPAGYPGDSPRRFLARRQGSPHLQSEVTKAFRAKLTQPNRKTVAARSLPPVLRRRPGRRPAHPAGPAAAAQAVPGCRAPSPRVGRPARHSLPSPRRSP